MSNDRERLDRLDKKNTPVAILHAGMYVYANPAFLRFFGYSQFSDIEGIPVLDMVTKSCRDQLLRHFDDTAGVTLNSPELPSASLTLIKADGALISTAATSFSTTVNSEQCIEVWLDPENDTADFSDKTPGRPWPLYLSLAFLCIFTLLPPTLLLKLSINNDPKVYFPDDEPAVVADRALREIFPNDQVLILLFESPALFSDDFLNAYHTLATRIMGNSQVEQVYGLTTQDHISGSEDGFTVEPIIDIGKLGSTTPEERKQQALADRFAENVLVSSDGTAISLVIVSAILDNSMQRLQLEQDIETAMQDLPLQDHITAQTGFIPLDIAELRSMMRDNMTFIPATICIGLFLIWWLFRRWLAVILGGISIGVVVGSTMSLFVLAGQPFTLLSSLVPPLLSALTVAALVHLYNALHYGSQRGLTGGDRVSHALSEIRRPALFTALTTAAGLLSLVTSPIPAIKTFGLVSAVGVMTLFFVVTVVLPPIFTHWDTKSWPHERAGLGWLDAIVRTLSHLGIRYPVWVILLISTFIAAGVPALWQIRVETSLQEFFAPDHPVRRDTNYFESVMSGTGTLDVVLTASQRDGLKNPEHLTFMRHFQRWAEQLPEVDKTVSPADFVEEMHWGFNAESPAFRQIPDDPGLVSQYLLVYDGEDMYDFVDREFKTSHISLSINVHPANDIEALMKKIRTYLHSKAPAGLEWEIAGNSRLFADMENLLVTGQIYSLFGALVLIFILMLVLWRSFSSAVLCMIPNISPILLIFIIMGLFGLWLDMATAMIASVAVGIAVDDTIHVYYGYTKRLKAGATPVTALIRTFSQAGRAVVMTTVILSAQFLILTLSLFQPTAHFGLLTSVGLWAALVFDLLLLPAILVLLASCSAKKQTAIDASTTATGS